VSSPTALRITLPRLALLLTLLVSLLSACSRESPAQAEPNANRSPPHLVEIAIVERDTLGSTAVFNGTLRSRSIARIHTQEPGRISDLPFFEGDPVDQGELLVTLDDALLQAQLLKARALKSQAEDNRRRLEDLGSRGLVSNEELIRSRTELAVARAEEELLLTRIGYMTLHAPFDGIVSERLVEPGDAVAANTHVLTLIDLETLITEVSVSELLLPHLRPGDPAMVRIDALGGAEFPGRINRIHPTLDPGSRTGVVEVALEPVPDGARPGQYCRVVLTSRGAERRLIPFSALRRDRAGEHVFRLAADGTVERVAVRSGLRLADRVEILEGLDNGDRVVIKGFLNLRAGMVVNVVEPRTAT
jgi:RND family efflux transporter MFP subunit